MHWLLEIADTVSLRYMGPMTAVKNKPSLHTRDMQNFWDLLQFCPTVPLSAHMLLFLFLAFVVRLPPAKFPK